MKKHYLEIDILKGIAIALVLLGHSIIVYPININRIPWCGFLHNLVSTVHMPVFFAVSGFCFSFHDWKSYLKKKAMRILVPMLCFGFIGIIPNVFFPSFVNKSKSLSECLLGIVTGESSWFLYTLSLIFGIFPFVYKRLRNPKFVLVFMLILLLNHFFVPYPSIFNLDNVFKYIIYFSGGYLVKQQFGDIQKYVKKEYITAIELASLILWLVLAYIRVVKLTGIENVATRIFDLCIALFGIMFWIGMSIMISKKKIGAIFGKFGEYSLQLFLFNGYFLTVGRTLTVKVLQITNPIVIIAVNFVLMYFVSYLLIKFVVSKVKLFRIITGIV